MSNLVFDLDIEGDYIDSFIYMGGFYLVDFDFNVKLYRWDEICDYLEKRNGFKNKEIAKRQFNFIKRSSSCLSRHYDEIRTSLTVSELDKLSSNCFEIGSYPSDINIFSKKLNYSCENGVFSVPVDTDKVSILSDVKKKIFDLRCFAISPNVGGRIALAAGEEGVHTCIYGYNNRSKLDNERQISTDDCVDIDWVNNYLLINHRSSNVVVNEYEKTISKPYFIKNKQMLINKLSSLGYEDSPALIAIKDDDINDGLIKKISKFLLSCAPNEVNLEKKYCYSWSSGDYNFLISENGIVDVYKDNLKISSDEFIKDRPSAFIKVRTSGCGTVIEDKNKLMMYSEDGLKFIDDNIVNWRVFPRAKVHAGHLHIVKDDYINVRVFNNEQSIFSSFLTNHEK